MKTLILLIALFISLSSFSQSINGTYVNEAGQKLIIKNHRDCCFDFDVTWGVNNEWGCLFEGGGTATYKDAKTAYYGNDPDWSEIDFNISPRAISVMGGLDFIGMDCAKYGDSESDKYTLFKKQ
tara:strand:- start:355 stop:726 length:372 start_codon:yes stop_codon:yes gene_type:complete